MAAKKPTPPPRDPQAALAGIIARNSGPALQPRFHMGEHLWRRQQGFANGKFRWEPVVVFALVVTLILWTVAVVAAFVWLMNVTPTASREQILERRVETLEKALAEERAEVQRRMEMAER